jgi:hypothetical protein
LSFPSEMKRSPRTHAPVSRRQATGIETIADSYRCPGCGVRVSNPARTAVALHHQHVLHPQRYPGLRSFKDRGSVEGKPTGQAEDNCRPGAAAKA